MSILGTADLLGVSYTQQSIGFTEMVYKRKDLMSSDSLGEKSFLASEENGLIVLSCQEGLNNDLFHFLYSE